MIRGASDRGWKGAAGRRSSAWPALHDREQDPDRRTGRAAEHLSRVVSTAVQTLKRLPNSLRLLIVFAIQPDKPATARWRPLSAASARWRWKVREQIALARDEDPHSATSDQLARFALATFDVAFLASQTDPGITLELLLEALASALVAARRQRSPNGRTRPATHRRRTRSVRSTNRHDP